MKKQEPGNKSKNINSYEGLKARINELLRPISWAVEQVTPEGIDPEYNISLGSSVKEICNLSKEADARKFASAHGFSVRPIMGVANLKDAEELFACQKKLADLIEKEATNRSRRFRSWFQ